MQRMMKVQDLLLKAIKKITWLAEPKPCSLSYSRCGCANLIELIEYGLVLLLWDADTGVADCDFYEIFPHDRFHQNPSAFECEFQRVTQQVEENLFSPKPVGEVRRMG